MKKHLSIILSLFTLTLANAQTNEEVISGKSNAIKLKIASQADITILNPKVPKGTTYYHDANKIVIKGNVNTDNLMFFTVDKMETAHDSKGNFEQEVKIKYDDNLIIVKAVYKNNKTVADTIKINRPFTANTDKLNNSYGKNYALLIGTNKYQHMTNLSNPVFDARTIAVELKDNYGFETDTVMNPSSDEIYSSIRKFSAMQFADDDQLFIFIAGHGEFDEVFKEGFIVPGDAIKNDANKRSYISHSNLRTIINNIPCKHIFLVMDVCFGGTFDPLVASRGTEKDESVLEREKFIKRKLKNKTRLFLTSGGKVYVPDGKAGRHSPFARKFIEALRTYGGEDKVLTFMEVVSTVEKVTPEPIHGEFGTNEPGSDFLFIAK